MFVSMCLFLKKSNAFTKFLKECIRGKGYDNKNATFPSLTDTNVSAAHSLRDDKSHFL